MIVKVDVKFDDIYKLLERTKNVKRNLSQQVLADSNYFIPKDTGELEQSSLIHSDFENGKLVWNTPYAARLYWNPQYNFSTDVNPHASGLWFEVAKQNNMDSWTRFVAKDLGL